MREHDLGPLCTVFSPYDHVQKDDYFGSSVVIDGRIAHISRKHFERVWYSINDHRSAGLQITTTEKSGMQYDLADGAD